MYLALKVTHVVAIISWMAGILYLFRLLIYDTKFGKTSEDMHKVFVLMQRRLYYGITIPAMSVALVSGLYLLIEAGFIKSGWMHSKLLFVVILKILTLYAGRLHKHQSKGTFPLSEKALRWYAEMPTLCMIVIVAMVIAKPF